MKKTIYIGGKVSGLSLIEASHKFGAAQKKLMEQGHNAIVPIDLVPNKCTWEEAMKICLPKLIHADELHLLPNWNDSKGAILEREIALKLNIPIVYL